MITPRYHLVTIVAIFLALGLGLLAGSSFGQPALVGQLQERTDSQLRRIEELRQEVDQARSRAESLDAFAGAAVPFLIAGRLDGYRAVVVTQEGVSSELESSVLSALTAAGAQVLTTLAAQPALGDPDPATTAELEGLLVDESPDTEIPIRVGRALARRFATSLAPLDPDVDIISELLEGGFLAARDGTLDDATRLGIRAGQLLIVVLGGTAEGSPPLTTRGFVGSLVQGLGGFRIPVAAVEISDSDDPWVAALSTDGVVTVIGAETSSGVAALILGLEDAILTGEGAAYGGDRAPLPALP